MKFVCYRHEQGNDIGILVNGRVYPIHALEKRLPADVIGFLEMGQPGMELARNLEQRLLSDGFTELAVEEPIFAAPVPKPVSCRDAYAFRQHVETSRRNRGLSMIPEFDQFPVYYYTNHLAIFGPDEVVPCMPGHFEKLDFELEVAVVLNKRGRNIKATEADTYIAGYMIMNDLSARGLQMEEMKLSLGPAKGKDFGTVLGPWLVTPDELEPYLVAPPAQHIGKTHNLDMSCKINGALVSTGNLKEMDWTFAEILERISYGVTVYPGEVIGSGTVGTGCFLELNGTGKLNNPDYREQWLRPGDTVELEVTGLGVLKNQVINDEG